jgi:hypothetical protein
MGKSIFSSIFAFVTKDATDVVLVVLAGSKFAARFVVSPTYETSEK